MRPSHIAVVALARVLVVTGVRSFNVILGKKTSSDLASCSYERNGRPVLCPGVSDRKEERIPLCGNLYWSGELGLFVLRHLHHIFVVAFSYHSERLAKSEPVCSRVAKCDFEIAPTLCRHITSPRFRF